MKICKTCAHEIRWAIGNYGGWRHVDPRLDTHHATPADTETAQE